LIFVLSLKVNGLKTEENLKEEEIDKETFDSINYYTNLIDQLKIRQIISLQVKNNRLRLRIEDYAPVNKNLFHLPKNLLMNSCKIFPFKEFLLKKINEIKIDFKADIDKIINNLILTYQIMYYRFGEKEKSKNYYLEGDSIDKEVNKVLGNVIPFEINTQLDSYIKNIPKNKRSVFFLNEEENQLSKDLKLTLNYKFLVVETHRKIVEKFKKDSLSEASVKKNFFYLFLKEIF
jgi:hypothetical protein